MSDLPLVCVATLLLGDVPVWRSEVSDRFSRLERDQRLISAACEEEYCGREVELH